MNKNKKRSKLTNEEWEKEMNTFAADLISWRERNTISRKILSETIGCTQETLRNFETRKSFGMRTKFFKNLLKAIGNLELLSFNANYLELKINSNRNSLENSLSYHRKIQEFSNFSKNILKNMRKEIDELLEKLELNERKENKDE